METGFVDVAIMCENEFLSASTLFQCRLVVAIQRIEGIEPAVVGFGPRRFAEWVQDMPARKLDGS